MCWVINVDHVLCEFDILTWKLDVTYIESNNEFVLPSPRYFTSCESPRRHLQHANILTQQRYKNVDLITHFSTRSKLLLLNASKIGKFE